MRSVSSHSRTILRVAGLCAVGVSVVGIGLLLVFNKTSSEWDRHEASLQLLIQKQAPKDVVIASLGANYVDYSLGSTNRNGLLVYLRNEPMNRLVEVRSKVEKWTNVLFYSTPDIMTWVFLNHSNRIVDYALSPQ